MVPEQKLAADRAREMMEDDDLLLLWATVHLIHTWCVHMSISIYTRSFTWVIGTGSAISNFHDSFAFLLP